MTAVIGIGNPLRQDDGIGWRATELLRAKLATGSAELRVCHQLTPELAATLEGASLVVFLDASVDQPAGTIVQRCLQAGGSFRFSHHLTPEQLLAVARDLHGETPLAILISGGVSETSLSDAMTDSAEGCAAQMADLAASLVARSLALRSDAGSVAVF